MTFLESYRSIAVGAALSFCILGLAAPLASAQQPTQAQLDAIKSSCRSDFMAQCSGVSPGGSAALACLQQHAASLSAPCQTAVGAVSNANAPAAATTTAPAAAATTAPAEEAPASTPPPAAAATAPSAPATATTGQATKKPTSAQLNKIKSACRSDFMAQCPGVTPGGSAALACLQQNVAQLSAPCRKAVSAVGGGSAATAPAAAPAQAAAPPPAAMPVFTPRQEVFVVRRACGPDFRALCGGVALGGGRAIACLRANLQRLSPACRTVLTSGL